MKQFFQVLVMELVLLLLIHCIVALPLLSWKVTPSCLFMFILTSQDQEQP